MQAIYEDYTHSVQFNKTLKLMPNFKFISSKTSWEHNFLPVAELISRSTSTAPSFKGHSTLQEYYWQQTVYEQIEIYLYKDIKKKPLTGNFFFNQSKLDITHCTAG